MISRPHQVNLAVQGREASWGRELEVTGWIRGDWRLAGAGGLIIINLQVHCRYICWRDPVEVTGKCHSETFQLFQS
uniref:Uncharacterized protein n=1 Tax=Xenopus tropicalis TaxID=8364 RepID=A0A1B8XVX4_XENTR